MTQEMIAELARKIAESQAHMDLKFYIILLCLVSVGSFVGAWLTSFATDSGKLKAIDANIGRVLNQLALTTQTATQIQLSLSHNDWVSKEYKTVRKHNLEKLLYALYETRDWAGQLIMAPPSAELTDITRSPINKVIVTSTLYFPELKQFEKNFFNAHTQFLNKHCELVEPIRVATFKLNHLTGVLDSVQSGQLQMSVVDVADMVDKAKNLRSERADAKELYGAPVAACYKALQEALLAFEYEIASTMSKTITS